MSEPILIHFAWVQGINELPPTFQCNLDLWQDALPAGFALRGWDHASALRTFPFYRQHSNSMSHHAMRADLILLSAQVEFGGLAIGCDMRPNSTKGLFEQIQMAEGFLIGDANGHIYNGMSFCPSAWDPRFSQILQIIEMSPDAFHLANVPSVSGPLRWSRILDHMDHGLTIIPDLTAWTRSYWDTYTTRPDAWVDPGFANSHLVPT